MSDITKKIEYGELENKEYQLLFKFKDGETVLGVINYDNGDVYMGEIKPDEKYDGKRDRRRHGYGKVFPKRGKVVDGEWHLGQVIGKSVTFDKKGKRTVEVRGSNPSFRAILYSYYLTDDNKYGGDNYNGLYKDKFWEGDFKDVLRRGELREQMFSGAPAVTTASTSAPKSAPAKEKASVEKSPAKKPAKAETPQKQSVNSKKNGFARYEFGNGDVYEGEYKDDKRHGKGRYTSHKGWTYEGDFMLDEMTGEGKVVFANGQTYEGGWLFGKRHGQGEEKYANGNRYVGEYNQDQFHGQGTYYYADGDIYEGSYEAGVRSGYGIYKSLTRGKDIYDCTEGNWKNGEREGWHKCYNIWIANGNVHPEGDRFYIDGERYKPDAYIVMDEYLLIDKAKRKGTIFNKWESIDKSKFNEAAAFDIGEALYDAMSDTYKYITENFTCYQKSRGIDTPNYEGMSLLILSPEAVKERGFGVQEIYQYKDYSQKPEREISKIRMYFHFDGRFVKTEFFQDAAGNLCGRKCAFEIDDWAGATVMDCLSIPESDWKFFEIV